jgi:hypothetical protein
MNNIKPSNGIMKLMKRRVIPEETGNGVVLYTAEQL